MLQGSGRMVVAIRIVHERYQTDPIAGFLILVEILAFEAGRDFIARFDNFLVEQLP